MQFAELMKQVEVVELAVGEFYERLSGQMPDKDVAACFKRLSMEERDHAAQSRLQANMALQNPSAFPGVKADAEAMDDLVAWVHRQTQSQDQPTVYEALSMAWEIEGSLAERYRILAVRAAGSEFAGFFQRMSKQEEGHDVLLREMGKQVLGR